MTPTEMMFYNVGLQTLEVTLVEIGDDEKFGVYLAFDKSNFHAHGGGQKGDRGQVTILKNSGEPVVIRISDTRGEKGGVIRHIVDTAQDLPDLTELVGNKAELQLNWPFRLAQMRLHSASHLIHVFMEREGGETLPMPRISDILETHGLLVYETELSVSDEMFRTAMLKLNTFLDAGHEIITYADPEKATYRFWECDGVTIPCGGTHPGNTRDIGMVEASIKVKKGSTRVHFEVRP